MPALSAHAFRAPWTPSPAPYDASFFGQKLPGLGFRDSSCVRGTAATCTQNRWRRSLLTAKCWSFPSETARQSVTSGPKSNGRRARRGVVKNRSCSCLPGGDGSDVLAGLDNGSGTLDYWVVEATTEMQLKAAARLRAQVFYDYPDVHVDLEPGTLEAAQERLAQEYRVRDMVDQYTRREAARAPQMEQLDMRVTTLLAACKASDVESVRAPPPREHPPSLPPSPRGGGGGTTAVAVSLPPHLSGSGIRGQEALVAIGTIDIQDLAGLRPSLDIDTFYYNMAAEAQHKRSVRQQRRWDGGQVGQMGPPGALGGREPQGRMVERKHGYVFSLGVLPVARGLKVATTLMQEVERRAVQMGLQVLYVHVEGTNTAALGLYESLGFTVELEEPLEDPARQRPQRMLLVKEMSS